jgi:Flp pilus assembly protein CpaB
MVGGLIVAGDRVDVIVLLKEDEEQLLGERALTLLQDVEVLAVAQNSQQPVTRVDPEGNPITSDSAEGELSSRPDDTEADEDARTVTLAVSPDDAALLALTQSDNADITVYLSLRPEGDREIVPLQPAEIEN